MLQLDNGSFFRWYFACGKFFSGILRFSCSFGATELIFPKKKKMFLTRRSHLSFRPSLTSESAPTLPLPLPASHQSLPIWPRIPRPGAWIPPPRWPPSSGGLRRPTTSQPPAHASMPPPSSPPLTGAAAPAPAAVPAAGGGRDATRPRQRPRRNRPSSSPPRAPPPAPPVAGTRLTWKQNA